MISQNNLNTIQIFEGFIIINGVKYDLPKKCKNNNVTQINGKIYINGYEFINGEFKKTLTALWHKLF